MKQTKTANAATPGFAIKLTEETDLESAMLICEDEEHLAYEPVGVVSTIAEAREVAERHFLHRSNNRMDGLCPFIYKLFARGVDGYHRLAVEIVDF